MENNELQSYIVKKRGKDEYYNLNEWIELYGKYLKVLKLLPQNPYNDPDGNSTELYKELSNFLNEQERKVLKGPWKYEPFKYGVKVTINKKDYFYLKSDQFGFSAPRPEKDHPYDIYLENYSDEDEDINRISEWIYYSRTIGGSFLWPEQIWTDYNGFRGGKKFSPEMSDNKYEESPPTKQGKGIHSYHMEDRVDLALLEIYLYYNKEQYKSNWEKAKLRLIDNEALNKWFDHFGKFKTYVKFFCFDEFVEFIDLDNDCIPKSIITGEALDRNPKSRLNGRLMIGEDPAYININRTIFDRVVGWIKKRSEAMEEIVRRS